MKGRGIALVALVGIGSHVHATLINPSFDNGLTGWSLVTVSEYSSAFPPSVYTVNGNLVMYDFGNPPHVYGMSQTFYAEANTVLSGMGIFYTHHTPYGGS